MSCEDCTNAIANKNGFSYRWKNAKIELLGCSNHIKEVMEALNKEQERQE